MNVTLLRAVLMTLLTSAAANAQGTTSTNRPAGTDFSVSTGIGSGSTVTTHEAEPGPPRGGSPVSGVYQSLPDEDQGKPDSSKIDHVKPTDTGERPTVSVPRGPNAIARDRVESPQDK
jgi:hypothetical protein